MQIKPNLPSFTLRDTASGPAQQTALRELNESRAGNVLFERRKKQMQGMQDAVIKLQELKKNTSPKKMANQRAALLKQRLDTLKSIMTKLPPGNYKALAQELKQIAKELAALGKQLGNSGGGLGNMPSISAALGAAMTDSAGEETAGVDASANIATSMPDTEVAAELITADEAQATAASATQTAEADAQQATQLSAAVEREVNANEDDAQNSKMDKPRIAGLRQSEDADDKALRAILTEASKTLKEVLSMLKAKHQVDDKESRKLLASIERELETLDQSLNEGARISPISAAVATGHVETDSVGAMGGFVDISV